MSPKLVDSKVIVLTNTTIRCLNKYYLKLFNDVQKYKARLQNSSVLITRTTVKNYFHLYFLGYCYFHKFRMLIIRHIDLKNIFFNKAFCMNDA